MVVNEEGLIIGMELGIKPVLSLKEEMAGNGIAGFGDVLQEAIPAWNSRKVIHQFHCSFTNLLLARSNLSISKRSKSCMELGQSVP